LIEFKRISDALSWSRGVIAPLSDSPGLDSQLLLAYATGQEKSWILSHPDYPLDAKSAAVFIQAVQRYESGEALPHILGRWDFYGRPFQLSPDVLIPRPETELVVEASIDLLNHLPAEARVADVGTGSGCIGITIALEEPDSRVVACDISPGALEVARRNALVYKVIDRLSFVQCDLLMPFSDCFELVIANLPYIPTAELSKLPVGKREPRTALDGGKNGIEVIDRFLRVLPRVLKRPGGAVIEIGAGQGEQVGQLAEEMLADPKIEIKKDLAGLERIIVIETG
jgi:release factor glutamine methyltransferase